MNLPILNCVITHYELWLLGGVPNFSVENIIFPFLHNIIEILHHNYLPSLTELKPIDWWLPLQVWDQQCSKIYSTRQVIDMTFSFGWVWSTSLKSVSVSDIYPKETACVYKLRLVHVVRAWVLKQAIKCLIPDSCKWGKKSGWEETTHLMCLRVLVEFSHY